MSEQIFETYRKVAESWFQMQQDLFRSAARGSFFAAPFAPPGQSTQDAQKRWLGLAVEIMHRHRESLDALYRAWIQAVEKASQIPEAKSSEDYRRATEDLWNSWVESVKNQSESQLRDARTFAEKSLDIAQGAHA